MTEDCPIDKDGESSDGANQDDITILGDNRDSEGDPMVK